MWVIDEAIYKKYKTKARFAETLGWSRQRLANYLTGQRMLSFYDARQMAAYLGLDATYVYDTLRDIHNRQMKGPIT